MKTKAADKYVVTGNSTLYAKWTVIKYSVSFKTNGGSVISAVSVEYGKTVDLSKYKPSRSGYFFTGWYKDSALKSKASGTVTVKSNLTYYAGWQKVSATTMYRLYNPNSGEHFYTANSNEKDMLKSVGWNYEGKGWTAPSISGTPVYRLYNGNAGDHHYTMNAAEKDMLVKAGWKYEGIGWYSDESKGVALYRQYNPNAKTGTHNYTTSKGENDHLVNLGWRAEGIGWYGMK